MNVNPLQRRVVASDIPPEDLAGNKSLTQQQKIAEASRQFESILLRQILSETQKPVITSEFTDNSTAAGIYQDLVSSTLADSISKSGNFGLAKIFDQQLSPHAKSGRASSANKQTSDGGTSALAGQRGLKPVNQPPAEKLLPLAGRRGEDSPGKIRAVSP